MMSNLYLGLVHHPAYNKFGDVVTTSITNLDVHDIARSCRTFGVKKYFIINPLQTQEDMMRRILKFWESDIAKSYNPDRVDALSVIEFVKDIDAAITEVKSQEGNCAIITTTAAKLQNQISFEECSKIDKPVLLLFGTGNGLAKSVHEMADDVLEPIEGVGNYNHLSVRSAVAIILNKLASEKYRRNNGCNS
jgi:hypothetical protein